MSADDPAAIRRHVEHLASDEMNGRAFRSDEARLAAAWIAEHALFALALIIVLPAPRSEDKSISMSLRHVWIASAMMTVSFLITWLRKQSSLASALLKSAIFLTFAYVLHAVLTMFAGARP